MHYDLYSVVQQKVQNYRIFGRFATRTQRSVYELNNTNAFSFTLISNYETQISDSTCQTIRKQISKTKIVNEITQKRKLKAKTDLECGKQQQKIETKNREIKEE